MDDPDKETIWRLEWLPVIRSCTGPDASLIDTRCRLCQEAWWSHCEILWMSSSSSKLFFQTCVIRFVKYSTRVYAFKEEAHLQKLTLWWSFISPKEAWLATRGWVFPKGSDAMWVTLHYDCLFLWRGRSRESGIVSKCCRKMLVHQCQTTSRYSRRISIVCQSLWLREITLLRSREVGFAPESRWVDTYTTEMSKGFSQTIERLSS